METDEVKFYYSRIPDTYELPKKGKPPKNHLYAYVRGDGFALTCPPASRGGRVDCTITAPDGKVYMGQAKCSCSDNFCYKTGREIALGRALKKKNSL